MSSLQPVPALSRSAPVAPGAARPGPRLLDPLDEQIRYLRHSIRTEEACVHGVRNPLDALPAAA